MSERKGQAKAAPSDSREALLQAAKRVFAAKGFEGATVKDLADEAGVNVSLVSYHFGGKENLYRECMESFGTERVESVERMLKTPTSTEEFKLRLKMFAEDIIAIHEREGDTCRMIHRSMDTLDPVSVDIFKNIFVRIFNALLKFVESGKRNGLVKGELDTEIVSAMLFGSLMHMVKAEQLRKILNLRSLSEPQYREAVIEHWVRSFAEGILT